MASKRPAAMAPQTIRSGNSFYLRSPMLSSAGHLTKFIIVTGGVCSSLGKGVTTSSIGALLKSQGYIVTSIKIDPYINVDAGLMSPFEHGEVFVLDDGGEVDLDLGNYERWLGVRLHRENNITTGKVYDTIIRRERRGEYLGKTVQVVPHFIDEVCARILEIAKVPVDATRMQPHVCTIELGGTVGDLESAPFIEALRQLRYSLRVEDVCLVHCSYLPVMGGSQKTKPTQHSVRTLMSAGLSPDLIVCRSDTPLEAGARRKIGLQCGVQESFIIDAHNVVNLYEVPTLFAGQGMIDLLRTTLRLHEAFGELAPPLPSLSQSSVPTPSIADFKTFSQRLRNATQTVKIAFVGKYVTGGTDAYFSVMQAFEHCCIHLGVKIEFLWIDAHLLENHEDQELVERLKACHGIYVAGGFGNRGIEGKIRAAKIARENKIPFLAVCFGFQLALIEIARSQLGLTDATSEELDTEAGKVATSKNHVVKYMVPDTPTEGLMGATMRLGGRNLFVLEKDSHFSRMYGGASMIRERHRHRYELNLVYKERLESVGVRLVCIDHPNFTEDTRCEAFELPVLLHPFFVGVQYHPEFITYPTDPSPPYLAFVSAAGGVPYTPSQSNSRRVQH